MQKITYNKPAQLSLIKAGVDFLGFASLSSSSSLLSIDFTNGLQVDIFFVYPIMLSTDEWALAVMVWRDSSGLVCVVMKQCIGKMTRGFRYGINTRRNLKIVFTRQNVNTNEFTIN